MTPSVSATVGSAVFQASVAILDRHLSALPRPDEDVSDLRRKSVCSPRYVSCCRLRIPQRPQIARVFRWAKGYKGFGPAAAKYTDTSQNNVYPYSTES